jgi:hypothetical protein
MRQLSTFFWGAFIGVVFMGLISWHYRQVIPPASIPSMFELQQELKDAGYYAGKIDGKIGNETLKAWDRYTCDKEYERSAK